MICKEKKKKKRRKKNGKGNVSGEIFLRVNRIENLKYWKVKILQTLD